MPRTSWNAILVLLFEADLAFVSAVNESNRLLAYVPETGSPRSLYERTSR